MTALGTQVATVVITVEAADVNPPLVFNLALVSGVATGTLRIPPGTNRTFSARAFESDGEISHEGTVTIAVVERGQNPPVSIPMVPRSGQQPVTVTIGPVSVVVSPAAATVSVGAELQLTAEVRAPDGQLLAVAPQWATTDPTVLTVGASGIVTALREGTADIVATYAGIAGASRITATEAVCGDGVIEGVEQCDDGNALPGDGCSATCTLEVAVVPGSVVFTEVLANPGVVTDTVGEWFELYNATAEIVDLAGCTISDNQAAFTVPAFPIAPGDYVVLGNNADPASNGGLEVDLVFAGLFLSNTSDVLTLTCGPTVIGSHAWTSTVNGVATQRDPASFGSPDGTWCSATTTYGMGDRGTPGVANLSCPVAEPLPEGAACALDAACATGRCDSTCQAKLADGMTCDEASDCVSDCVSGVCGAPVAGG